MKDGVKKVMFFFFSPLSLILVSGHSSSGFMAAAVDEAAALTLPSHLKFIAKPAADDEVRAVLLPSSQLVASTSKLTSIPVDEKDTIVDDIDLDVVANSNPSGIGCRITLPVLSNGLSNFLVSQGFLFLFRSFLYLFLVAFASGLFYAVGRCQNR